MPKQLLIVRHAKSDWNDYNLRDFDRPLNERGSRNAPEMAMRLVKSHLVPQKLISSPAVRALSTAESFAEAFNIEKNKIKQLREIYEAHTSTLLEIINGLNNRYDYVALFGHNPGVTNLVVKLTDADIYDIPTCGIVLIEFPFDDWGLISSGTGKVNLYDFPKNKP
ncbi:MAG TPA: histidine phosphatase family protein [Sphingobacteriaceae bacterium]